MQITDGCRQFFKVVAVNIKLFKKLKLTNAYNENNKTTEKYKQDNTFSSIKIRLTREITRCYSTTHNSLPREKVSRKPVLFLT